MSTSLRQYELAVTKDEHDAIVAMRGRNLTDGPIRRHAAPVEPDPGPSSIVDRVIADTRRGNQ